MTRFPNRAPKHYVRVTVAPGVNDRDFTLVVDAEKLALNIISRGIRRYRRNFMAGPC